MKADLKIVTFFPRALRINHLSLRTESLVVGTPNTTHSLDIAEPALGLTIVHLTTWPRFSIYFNSRNPKG
jgi:hypothetical protein